MIGKHSSSRFEQRCIGFYFKFLHIVGVAGAPGAVVGGLSHNVMIC